MAEVTGAVTYGLIEVTGRAQAGNKIEVRVVEPGGESTLLGSTAALPASDPFIQRTPSSDGTSVFSFRGKVAAGRRYRFEVIDLKGGPISVGDLRLKDLCSEKSYRFSRENSETESRATTELINVTPR
jgi:hypothetical protein